MSLENESDSRYDSSKVSISFMGEVIEGIPDITLAKSDDNLYSNKIIINGRCIRNRVIEFSLVDDKFKELEDMGYFD